MEAFDQLDLVAEIAAALLGFIAVFLALSKSDGRFAESDRHFIQALVVVATMAIILSLTPRALSLFETAVSIWIISTLIGMALGFCTMVYQLKQQLRMSSEEAEQIHIVWHIVAWGLALAIGVLFIIGLFMSSLIIPLYVAAVSMMIPLCLWVFIGVVFRRFF